jgi:hypothetical protein
VYACGPSYAGGAGRRMVVARPFLKNKLKQKGCRRGSSGEALSTGLLFKSRPRKKSSYLSFFVCLSSILKKLLLLF